MKTRKKKISKSERIPKIGSPSRDILLEIITEIPDYKNAMKRGLRLFTKDELESIENKFNEGLTWNEIESVMSSKGNLLKYATFRKYIQDAIIPKAERYKTNENGRVAVYPANIIRHLNCVNFFYNATDPPMIDFLMKTVGELEITYNDAIESYLGGSGCLIVEVVRDMAFGNSEAADAIAKVLAKRDDKQIVLEMVNNLQRKFDKYIAKDLNELIKYLATKRMLVTQIPDNDSKDTVEVQS
jgi:hypothetical protein